MLRPREGSELNFIDAVIVVFALALAVVGWHRGLLASALPLAGFLGGAALGARLGPALLEGGSQSRFAPLVSVVIGVLIGALVAVALEGVGRAIRTRLDRARAFRLLDGVGGAALLAALALLLAWGFATVALHTTDAGAREVREAVQRSRILTALNDALPPSGPLLNVLRRVDPRPTVRGPEADVAAPANGILADPDVRAGGDSTVRVLGTACGLGVAGSGWVAAPGLVVTNAHVVAGADDTTVVSEGGVELEAMAVFYEPRNDLALLRVDGLPLRPLALAPRTRKGAEGAVVGFPENGPLTFTAARLGRTGTVVSQDSYGRGPVERSMTPLRADVRSGNSGGPVLDAGGRVATTVFAAATGKGPAGGLGVPNPVVEDALRSNLRATDTGPCAV